MLRRTWLLVLPLLVILGSAIAPAADAQPYLSTRQVTASSTYTYTTTQFEARLLARTNARRARIGCRALVSNKALVTSSRAHSARMASVQELSHQLTGEVFFATRISRAGYKGWRLLAENIAWGAPMPPTIFSAWIASPPHRLNIDNCGLHEVGFGVSYAGGNAWVTMDMGRR